MVIDLYVSTNKVGSECRREVEIDDEDWASMTPMEREQFMSDELWGSGLFEWYYQERE